MHTRHISAEHVLLALVARKVTDARWAAMSNGASTAPCARRSAPSYRLPHGPLMVPMDRGNIFRAIDRVRCHGRDELKRTFGLGIRALRAETQSFILRRPA